jgi:hypothetical protein
MHEEFRALRDIMLRLHQSAMLDFVQIQREHRTLASNYPPMRDEQLQNLMGDKTNNPKANTLGIASRALFYLPPLKDNREYSPALALRCKYTQSSTKMNLFLLMFREVKNQGGEVEIKWVGFRFDSPHENTKHDYWHTQPTTRISGRVNIGESGCPSWICHNIPCIPTSGKNPLALVASMLVSLYGRDEVTNRLLADLRLGPVLGKKWRDALEEMAG